MEKKLIYILNHYSKNSVQHFFHVIHLLECIAEQGVQIALIVEKCDDELVLDSENIKVYAQKEINKKKRAKELFVLVRRLVRDEGYKKIFVRISKYAAMLSCMAAHKYGGEVYFWQSGDTIEFYMKKPLKKRLPYILKDYSTYNLVTRMVDYFVTGPEYMVKYYSTTGHVKQSKIKMLYNDIDTSRFTTVSKEEKTKLREELKLDKEKQIILQIHRMSEYRRTDFYIPYIYEGIKNRDDVEIIIIGDGPEKEDVVEKVVAAGLKTIKFLPSQPNNIIQKYYQACDIFVNPSWSEGFPRVVIEAMACGKPIVATAAGGTRDLFDSKQQSFIINIDDRDALTTALEKMINNKNLQVECGVENIKRVARYDTRNVSKMYVDMLWG